MRVFISFFITFLLLGFLQAYDWSQFGMDSGEINNFCFLENAAFMEVICSPEGFYIYENDSWVLYSYGNLPVWQVCADDYGNADLILIMGDGTYSDGIYSYSFDLEEFTVRHWFLQPDFIERDEISGTYFVGGTNGLVSSEDGVIWQELPYFSGMDCHAMAIYGSNYVVSANDYDLFYSDDAGENWYTAESYLLISDLAFDSTGKLYGIFPDMSWSSGLWSSYDYGINWQVEFWDTMLNSVFIDLSNKVFVGWKDGTVNQGIAQWIAEEEGFYFYNYGLPDYNINKITTHPFIDCINIICCTDDGSYMLTDYEITAAGEDIPEGKDKLSIFPNPFNPDVVISFQLAAEKDHPIELSIHNLKGQVVKKYSIFNNQSAVTWNGIDNHGNAVSSGLYFARLVSSDQVLQKKMILIK